MSTTAIALRAADAREQDRAECGNLSCLCHDFDTPCVQHTAELKAAAAQAAKEQA